MDDHPSSPTGLEGVWMAIHGSPGGPLMVVRTVSYNSALIRPLEELLHQKCGALRGELDSSTPRAFGVFWMVVVEG